MSKNKTKKKIPISSRISRWNRGSTTLSGLDKVGIKLPESFRYLLWSYRFPDIDPEDDKERIIINTINYGNWEHWQWIINHYGIFEVKRIIENTPASEFRPRVLKLVILLLKIKKIKYATRSAKIRAAKGI